MYDIIVVNSRIHGSQWNLLQNDYIKMFGILHFYITL